MADIKVFICYSHKDKTFVDELLRIFAGIKGAEAVYDYKFLKLGDKWNPTILEHLASSQILIAMTSLNFFASEYIQLKEWKESYARAQVGQCKIIPVRVGDARVTEEISQFQGVSEEILAKMEESDRDTYYVKLQAMLQDLVNQMGYTDLQEQKDIAERNKIFLSVPETAAGQEMRKLFVDSYATARKHDPGKWTRDLVPEINDDFYVKSLQEKQSIIENAFKKAIYSIHIATSTEDISSGSGKFQFDQSGDFKRILWCPNDSVKSNLYSSYNQYIFEVGEKGSNLLKKIVEVEEEKARREKELDVKTTAKRKIFWFFKPDEDDKKEWFREIREKIKLRGHDLVPAEETTSAVHARVLQECRGALIFHGVEKNSWCISKQNFITHNIPGLSACAICIDAPGEEDKEQAVYSPFDSIRRFNFDPKLNQFLDKVEGARL